MSLSLIKLQDISNFYQRIDSLLLAKVISTASIGLTAVYFGKIWYSYRFFKKRGIKTPKYKFISGHFDEIIEKNYSEALKEWSETYGKTYGIYEGHLPVLVTSDLNLLEEVFNKQFRNFIARRKLPFQSEDNGPECEVFMSSRTLWKRLRAVQKGAFSPTRLKEILPIMRQCSDRLISIISKNIDKEIKINEFFDNLSMDVVWNCGYGINTDLQMNPNFPFLIKVVETLKQLSEFNLIVKILLYFHEIKPILLPVISFITSITRRIDERLANPNYWLQQRVNEVLDRRLKNKTTRQDYLQNLIDLQSDNVNKKMDNENYDITTQFERNCTYQEILSSLIGFMIAAFDTTSSTLNFCLYCMVKYPEEMAKLQQEVDSIENDELDYDEIEKLKYMDIFIKEVHRMHPIAPNVITRRCTKATKIGDLEIPEGLLIAANILSLHYDPQYWGKVDPNVFYPERFNEVNNVNKMVYMPFGAGPRTCVGMKFATMEIKLVLFKLIRNFDIFTVQDLSGPIKVQEGPIRRAKHDLKLIFKKRK